MLVKDIMTHGVRTVQPETPLLEVSSLMCLYRLSGLPVVSGGKLVGFVAEKDVLSRLFPSLSDLMESMATVDYAAMEAQYKEIMHLKTADIMTARVITVHPDMQVLQAAAAMARHNFRRIPVATGDRLEGMVSLGDVHKALFHSRISQGGR